MEQGSESWFQARAGKATASRVGDIIARTKTGYSASRRNYCAELVVERLTGRKTQGFQNAHMLRGTELEPEARATYSFTFDTDVTEVGFIDHPTIPMAGASPDGLIGLDGLLEIKCPAAATHLDYLLSNDPPGEYQPQMAWQMACTGRAYVDFVSYHPDFPERARLVVRRFHRNDAVITLLEADVREFLAEVDAKVAAVLQAVEREAA